MYKNKKWFGYLTTLILSLGLLVGCSGDSLTEDASNDSNGGNTETVIVSSEELIEATLSIYVGDVEQEEFTHLFEVEEGTTLLELMKDHYRLVEEDGYITCIEGNGQDVDEGKFWVYDVNGEMGEVGAADYIITDGDTIEWKLTTFE